MLVTPPALRGLMVGFKTIFQKAFDAAPTFHEKLTTRVPSTTRAEVHGFLDRIPGMREWVGDRVLNNLVAREFTVVNKPYEATIEVDRDDIEDDTLGVYGPRLEMLGMQARKHPDYLVVDALQEGNAAECYDGQYFFDTDHPVSMDDPSMGTQSNNLNLALNGTNYGVARAAMSSFKAADGKPLAVVPTLLVVPPQLESAGRQILNSENNAAGATNEWKNTAELLVVPELANEPTAWYLIAAGMPVKPFLRQVRKEPEFASITDTNSESVFMKKKFRFGVDSRGAVAYGPWFLALRSKP